MAAVTGTVQSVALHSTPFGPKKDSSGNEVLACLVVVTFAGTYAAADDSSTASVNTAIANARRDGKTVTLIDACFCAPGSLAGSIVGANSTAVSGGTVTAQLTGSDLSTELANGALGTWDHGIGFYVTYKLS